MILFKSKWFGHTDPLTHVVDTHCHLLHCVDDGAQSEEQAIELAKHAVLSGITHAVLTPHIHLGRYNNSIVTISERFYHFQSLLKQHEIPLHVGMAAEVRIDPHVLKLIDEGMVPFLGEFGGNRIMLLELPHQQIPVGTNKFIEQLHRRGIRPMIAHPERNKDVLRDYEKMQSLFDLDCLFQVTASSVAGAFGEDSQRVAHQLLREGKVTVLASDAHNLRYRPPELEGGRKAAAKIVGEAEANKLVSDYPMEIVAHQFADACVDVAL